MAFLDLVPRYSNEDEEDNRRRRRPFDDEGDPADLRRAIQEVQPEAEGAFTRLRRGFLHDVGDLGTALGAPIYYGARELYRTVRDPQGQAEKYRELVGKVAADPYGTAQKVASAVGEGIIAPYRPREGEGVLDVAKRNVLDRPLSTLMDVSALVGIPAGAASKIGLPGAKIAADLARKMDPLTLADAAVRGALKTTVPDALQRLEASRAITELASQQKLRATAVHNDFAKRNAEIFANLEPAEKALFFPYVEGRLKAITEGPETGILQELTPEGVWAPRGIDQGRLQRLEEARQRYLPVLDDLETQMGYRPEQAAQRASDQIMAKADPMDPAAQMRASDAAELAAQEAEERQKMRRTLSIRTSLDVAKEREFKAEVARLELEGSADAVKEAAARYPVKPATPEEAMQVWGPQGGAYFPHSGEVFTRDQVTIGNLLTKVRESVPWKQNKGTLYRTGALDQMDPEKALLRTHAALRGGMGRAEILDALGQKFGQKLEGNYKFGSDPDFRAGTHQLLRPGLLHQEAALGEDMNDLMQTLLRHGDDPGVAALNIQDLTERAAAKIDARYPMRKDAPVYKVPKAVADSMAGFVRSLEPPTSNMAQWLDTAADPFHFVTLNLRPARIVNNLIGNTTFQVLQGIHPFSTTGIGAISDMVRAVAYKAGLSTSEKGKQLAQVFDLPGVSTGGFTGQQYESRTAEILKGHPLAKMLGGKQLAAYGDSMGRLNEHVENTARALSTLFELRKQSPGLMARMASSAKTTMDLGDRLDELAARGVGALDDAGYAGALKNVNRFLADYGRTSPFERQALRRIFPYQKFYRHSIELAARAPFEQPAKVALLRSIGRAAQQDFKDTLEGWGFDPLEYVPPWMQNAVPIAVEDDPERGPHVRLLNLQGPNPFSLLSAAAEGDPGREGLAALHPAIKAAAESALGINLFTMEPFRGPTTTYGGKEVDPLTGRLGDATVRPGPIAQFARQFFPVQLARDLLAGGRQPLDASSLLDQFRADMSGTPGTAYKVNERGEAIERPKANPWARLFVPVPHILEAPTEGQLRAERGGITESYRKLGRSRPDLQDELRGARRRAATERREQRLREGRPYRVRPRAE